MGLFYEQFELNKTLETRRRTLTEADIVAFAGISGDYSLVHTDEVFAAAETPFGTRIAHGPLGLSVAIGLLSQLNVIEDTALALLNLTVTFAITVGIWPVVAHNFGQISFLVFLGNLVMIPILSMLVLPSGLLALLVSMVHLGGMPGGWAERAAFGWLELVLSGWLWTIHTLDELGRGLVVPARLDWGPQAFFAYYTLVFAAMALLWRHLGRRGVRNFF